MSVMERKRNEQEESDSGSVSRRIRDVRRCSDCIYGRNGRSCDDSDIQTWSGDDSGIAVRVGSHGMSVTKGGADKAIRYSEVGKGIGR